MVNSEHYVPAKCQKLKTANFWCSEYFMLHSMLPSQYQIIIVLSCSITCRHAGIELSIRNLQKLDNMHEFKLDNMHEFKLGNMHEFKLGNMHEFKLGNMHKLFCLQSNTSSIIIYQLYNVYQHFHVKLVYNQLERRLQ